MDCKYFKRIWKCESEKGLSIGRYVEVNYVKVLKFSFFFIILFLFKINGKWINYLKIIIDFINFKIFDFLVDV